MIRLPLLFAVACCLACGPTELDEAEVIGVEVQQLDFQPPPIQCSAPEIVDVPLRLSDRIGLTIQDHCSFETSNVVQRMQPKIAPWTTVATLPGMTGTYSLNATWLSPSTYYCFQVVAGFSGGSLTSATECARTVPTPPAAATGVTAISKTGTSITLRFTDNSLNEAGFQLVRSTLPEWTETPVDFPAQAGTGTREITDTGIDTVARAYCYRVRAFTFDGIDRGYATSNQACVYLPPDPPTGLSTSPQLVSSDHRVLVTWNDVSSVEDGFELQRRLEGSSTWSSVAMLAANAESYNDGSLIAEARYCYRVRAFRGISESFSSEQCTWTHPAVAPAPTGFSAGGITQTSATLSWNDVTTNETSFRLATSGGSTISSLPAHGGTGSMSFAYTGLSAGTHYTVEVTSERCANSLCARSAAATVSFDTEDPPPACSRARRVVCGTGSGLCPDGYHAVEFACDDHDSDGNACSGDCAHFKKSTRCDENDCGSFTACGSTCPDGYTEGDRDSLPQCDPEGDEYGENAIECIP